MSSRARCGKIGEVGRQYSVNYLGVDVRDQKSFLGTRKTSDEKSP